jgi:hypothetical protein
MSINENIIKNLMKQKGFNSFKETAKYLNVSVSTLYRFRKNDEYKTKNNLKKNIKQDIINDTWNTVLLINAYPDSVFAFHGETLTFDGGIEYENRVMKNQNPESLLESWRFKKFTYKLVTEIGDTFSDYTQIYGGENNYHEFMYMLINKFTQSKSWKTRLYNELGIDEFYYIDE